MATYVLLSTLTPSGGSTLHAHPHRLKEVNTEITEFGCKVIAQYALLGPYDFLSIVVDAARVLTIGGPTSEYVIKAIAWIVGIIAVCAPIAVSRYRRAV